MDKSSLWLHWRVYIYTLVFTGAIVLVRVLAEPWLGRQPLLLIFLIPVILAAYMGGLRPGLFATALSALCAKLWVFPPASSIWFETPLDFAYWLSLLLVGATLSMLFDAQIKRRAGETDPHTEPRHANADLKVRVGFTTALILLGAICLASYLNVARFSQNTELISRSLAVVTTVDALVATTLAAEAELNTYLVTGDGSTAPDFARSSVRIEALLQQLRAADIDNPAQLARVEPIEAAARARLKLGAELVSLRKLGGMEAVQQRLDQDLSPSDGPPQPPLQALAQEMKEVEFGLIGANERDALARANSTASIIVLGSGLAFIFIYLAMHAIRRDIAIRKRAESELNRFFDLTIDLFVIATPDGRFQRISPAVKDILGYTVEEALALDYMQMQHPDDLARTAEVVDKQSRLRERVNQFESRFRHKDGTYRLLSWRSQPHGGYFYATARDATESAAAAEALREAKEQLEVRVTERTRELGELNKTLQRAYDDLRTSQQQVLQQERLRALGQMASGIAHDINNAISPVGLYTEDLLERETSLSSRARAQLEIIQRAVGDVAQTVSRLGEFYRQREQQQPLLPVDLNSLVGQVIALTRARWSDMAQQRGTAIEIRTDLAPDLPQIDAVESQIRDALVNLVFNAVDAMPEGGPITISTSLTGTGATQRVLLEVQDSGIGMDEDTIRHCREPFFTTKGERGTGLGLSMVHGIAQRHDARLEIESEPGNGTTIRMAFTIAQQNSATRVEAHTPLPSPQRILLIDDEPLLLKSLREALETDGHDVSSASGGQAGIEAFELAMVADKPFPVVITDLGMPHVDGRKVAATIKARAPATRVIMLTGWGQSLIAEGDVPPCVDLVLAKPPRLAELRAALARIQDHGNHAQEDSGLSTP